MKWILEEKISKLYVSVKALDRIEHEELTKAIKTHFEDKIKEINVSLKQSK